MLSWCFYCGFVVINIPLPLMCFFQYDKLLQIWLILNFTVDLVIFIVYGNDSMFIGSIEWQLLLQIALWPETMIRELFNFPNLCCPCHCKITNGWCETDTHSNHRHRSSKICSFFDKKLQSFAFASFVLTKFFIEVFIFLYL